MNESWNLHKQIEAAKILKADLADLVEDDPEFLADAIEGETDLFEAIDALVLSIRNDEAVAEATGNLIKHWTTRKARFEGRADLKRALIAAAMDLAEIRKRESPAGTVSTRDIPPKALVIDEAQIPARFWKAQAPKLDKAELTKALRADEQIPGASLSNGSRTIAIRG